MTWSLFCIAVNLSVLMIIASCNERSTSTPVEITHRELEIMASLTKTRIVYAKSSYWVLFFDVIYWSNFCQSRTQKYVLLSCWWVVKYQTCLLAVFQESGFENFEQILHDQHEIVCNCLDVYRDGFSMTLTSWRAAPPKACNSLLSVAPEVPSFAEGTWRDLKEYPVCDQWKVSSTYIIQELRKIHPDPLKVSWLTRSDAVLGIDGLYLTALPPTINILPFENGKQEILHARVWYSTHKTKHPGKEMDYTLWNWIVFDLIQRVQKAPLPQQVW